MAMVGTRMKLGSVGLEVSAQGLGCMGMSAFYGPPKPEPDMVKLIHYAINCGVTFLDTSDVYGPHTNEILLGKALKGGMRERVVLATKFGIVLGDGKKAEGKREVHGDPAYVRAACEVGELKKLVEEGKIKYIGLSEVSASTIRRAHARTRNWDCGIQSTRKGLFIIRSEVLEEMSNEDYQKHMPRFQGENLEHNKKLYERICQMAAKKGCTPSQLALAWVHHQGSDVSPIPGTTKIENFNQNIGALSIKLTPEDMEEVESIASASAVQGDRYIPGMGTYKNSETPPLSTWKAT
ncbi:unnamed protein product [Withania somnifera]